MENNDKLSENASFATCEVLHGNGTDTFSTILVIGHVERCHTYDYGQNRTELVMKTIKRHLTGLSNVDKAGIKSKKRCIAQYEKGITYWKSEGNQHAVNYLKDKIENARQAIIDIETEGARA